ncbi:hypothetical protein HMPREF1320_0849 [Capnocytophaga sp. oral taxon 335 str. F0486]|nr:hypothetical protein HMPREF1320_0849 [Capnocytophaga sp. oral taxon 335 str. F0486]
MQRYNFIFIYKLFTSLFYHNHIISLQKPHLSLSNPLFSNILVFVLSPSYLRLISVLSPSYLRLISALSPPYLRSFFVHSSFIPRPFFVHSSFIPRSFLVHSSFILRSFFVHSSLTVRLAPTRVARTCLCSSHFSVTTFPLSFGEGRGEDSLSFASKPRF